MSSFYWMDNNSDSFPGFISGKMWFFLFENKTSLSCTEQEQVLRTSFYHPFLVSFSLLIAGFFRSEQWAFKNRGLKFGEKGSCASCGEEKHFGSWRWMEVSQQGAAADPIPLIIPELFCGGHLLQLQLSHWSTKLVRLLVQRLCMSSMIQIRLSYSGAIIMFAYPH